MSHLGQTSIAETTAGITKDGLIVRALASLPAGSMAHFTLAGGQVSAPCRHGDFGELWFVLSGAGWLWRSLNSDTTIIELRPGQSFDLPPGVTFQMKAQSNTELEAIAVTIPPFDADKVTVGDGIWTAQPPRTDKTDELPADRVHGKPAYRGRGYVARDGSAVTTTGNKDSTNQ